MHAYIWTWDIPVSPFLSEQWPDLGVYTWLCNISICFSFLMVDTLSLVYYIHRLVLSIRQASRGSKVA